MVLEKLVFLSPLNLLTRLVAREDFIIHSRREISKPYNFKYYKKVHERKGVKARKGERR
jgi:hypothetical protein